MLPEVVDAVAGRLEVLVDGGIRRGTDVLVALALGARAVLVGRPALWGLAAGGEAGARDVLRDCCTPRSRTALALLGCTLTRGRHARARRLSGSVLDEPGADLGLVVDVALAGDVDDDLVDRAAGERGTAPWYSGVTGEALSRPTQMPSPIEAEVAGLGDDLAGADRLVVDVERQRARRSRASPGRRSAR